MQICAGFSTMLGLATGPVTPYKGAVLRGFIGVKWESATRWSDSHLWFKVKQWVQRGTP